MAPALAPGGGDSLPVFPYRRPPELDGGTRRHPVVVGGLSGLTAACDLASRDIPMVLPTASRRCLAEIHNYN
jgi:hypothetical protein